MRRRVIMRRRNSCLILVVLLGLTPYFLAQSGTAPQPQPPAATTGAPATTSTPTQAQPPATTTGAPATTSTPAQAQPPATTTAAPATTSAPTQTPSTQAPPTQTPAEGTPAAPAQQPTQGAGQGQAAPPAQTPDSDAGVFVFRKEVEEVVLHATVFDDKQRFVTNLEKNAFSVFEDGHPQTITSFRHEDIPVSIGIVVDNSGSMREKRQKVNAAALNLVRASNPNDEVFVVNFNDEYYLDQDFTANINKLREAMEKIETRGGTALYDAVVASADWLKRGKLEKKVIFVVTDGEDTASSQSLEQAVRHLQEENGPTVYSIAILGDEEHPKRAKRALQVMSDRTGGIAFFPKTLDEVDAISRAVAHDIRNQYTIGYKPTTPM